MVSARVQRIFNGENAKIEDFPYQASLRLLRKHHCGGSIITQRHILTAAHCVEQKMYPPFIYYRVVTGTSSRKGGGITHQIVDITTHPDYWGDDNRAVHDIAVITVIYHT